MKILLAPPKPDCPSFEIDHQISVALRILYAAFVKIRGAGRFGSDSATILLEHDQDANRALDALRGKGIEACTEPEAPSPGRARSI
jgi:hypothetical protein